MYPDWNRWVTGTQDHYFSFYPLAVPKKGPGGLASWVGILEAQLDHSRDKAGAVHIAQQERLQSQAITRVEGHRDIKNDKYGDYTKSSLWTKEVSEKT